MSQAVDARETAQDVDAHVTSGMSDTVVASDDLAEKEEEDEVLADSKIPFGPLGKILPEEYSDLERQVRRGEVSGFAMCSFSALCHAMRLIFPCSSFTVLLLFFSLFVCFF